MKYPKHILITGASSGIGAALAKRYAVEGICLFLQGRNEERLEAVSSVCRELGAEVFSVCIDVTDKKALSEWMISTEKEHSLDLVIANAGISGGTQGVMSGESFDQIRKIFDVNITGVLNTIEPVIDYWKSSGKGGQVAIMSSLAGFRGYPSAPAYCSSKAAVRLLGEGLRGSLKDAGIQINVICPGFVTSPMTDANDFTMPFKMSVERAANIIANGLAKNKGRIMFPWPVAFVSWFIGILPDFIAQRLLTNVPGKSPL